MLAPERIVVPAPDFVAAAVPARMAETVPPCRSKKGVPPVTTMVPVVLVISPEVICKVLTDWAVVPRSRVPPLTSKARPTGKAPLMVSCRVPPVTLVPPV